MKLLESLVVLVSFNLLASCSLLSNEGEVKESYNQGFRAGVANEVKRRYWADQNTILPALPEEAQFHPVLVPEHTAPDGVIIEEHEVETPTLPTP